MAARAVVSSQTTLLEERQEHLDTKVMGLKDVQSRSDMTEDKLITLYDAQNKVLAGMKLLKLQTENKTSEPVGLESVVKETEWLA